MKLTFNSTDAKLYQLWLRFMLGMAWSPCATREADDLFRRHGEAIRRFARTLSAALLPHIWNSTTRTLYRGLRLARADLDGQRLPPNARYDTLPALSFSEDANVAAYFADPGPKGMPSTAVVDLATGAFHPALPPHGYIATAVVGQSEVLFHWRYFLALPWLLSGAPGEDLGMLFSQREVTVLNSPDLELQLQAFHLAAADYIACTYPDGRQLTPADTAHGRARRTAPAVNAATSTRSPPPAVTPRTVRLA